MPRHSAMFGTLILGISITFALIWLPATVTVCLDSTTDAAQDDGCSAQAPLCGAGGMNVGTNVGGNVCYESCRNLRDRTELFLFLLTKCMLMCSSESIILLDLRPACLDNATTSNRDVGCPADKPLCGSGGFNAGTYIGGSVCFGACGLEQ
eukprot:jgi/Mesvir1/435/Mv11316-RA.1